jgi:hypothetical protein
MRTPLCAARHAAGVSAAQVASRRGSRPSRGRGRRARPVTPEGSGARVALDHTGYPADQHDHLSAGWPANYFEPLAKYFA